MPAMIFISVDLPAPFSPISAWTWPRLSRNETSSSASTPGKALRTLATSSRYSAPGTAPLCRTISAVDGLMVAMALRPALARSDSWFAGAAALFSHAAITIQQSAGGWRLARLRRPSLWGIRDLRSVLLHELVHVGRRHE